MTRTHTIELESLVLFLVAAGMGAIVSYALLHKPQTQAEISLPVNQANANVAISPSPLPSPFLAKPLVSTQISPDGTKLLTLTIVINHDLSKTYTFVASDADGSNGQTVYTITLSGGDTMSIPFNTWSPDDTYVFITRSDGAGSPDALVMRADGTPLTSTDTNLDVKTLFASRNTGNTYQETIGWASNTLLIINTTQQDGSQGSSYWFEVPSGAIIQLSTQF